MEMLRMTTTIAEHRGHWPHLCDAAWLAYGDDSSMDRWRERQTDRGVGCDNGLDLREDEFCQSISFPLPFDELHVSVPTVAETVGLSIDLVWRHFGCWPTHCRVSASCFAARGAGDAHWDWPMPSRPVCRATPATSC
jgi:hypothetical protein